MAKSLGTKSMCLKTRANALAASDIGSVSEPTCAGETHGQVSEELFMMGRSDHPAV